MLEFFFLFIHTSFFITIILFFVLTELDVKIISFVYSTVLFLLSVVFLNYTDFSTVSLNCFTIKIFEYFNILLTVGLDQFSLMFILLVTFLFPLVIMAGWTTIKFNIKFFYLNILFLEYCLINVFMSFDLLFFYVWFEATVIPMFFIIVVWGAQSNKIKAAFYLLLYTLIFSMPFLLCIVYIHSTVGTTNIFLLTYNVVFSENVQKVLLICFFFAFAVKLPIYPFHLWLPEAHVEAPTCGSMILAGILLKLGYYGFVRFFIQLFPEAVIFYTPFISTLCVLGSIYAALIALSQTDLKKIIAYSSVSHMNFCMLGILSKTTVGLLGSFLMAVGHGFVSTALFFLIGVIYERSHTRLVDYYSGISQIMPVFSFFMFIFLISNFGFPISLNFVAELLILIGIGSWSFSLLIITSLYSVLSVGYNLWLYVRTCHGTVRVSVFKSFKINDISILELKILLPLMFCNSFLCFFPNIICKNMLPFFLLIS